MKCTIKNLRDGSVFIDLRGKRFLLSAYMVLPGIDEDAIGESTRLLMKEGVISIVGEGKVEPIEIPKSAAEMEEERKQEPEEEIVEDNTSAPDSSEQLAEASADEEVPGEEAKEEGSEEPKEVVAPALPDPSPDTYVHAEEQAKGSEEEPKKKKKKKKQR